MLPSSLVSPAWLQNRMQEPPDRLRIVDSRWYLDGRSGRDAFAAGHIAGAVFADLDTDLSAPPHPEGGRHPLPEPNDFAVAMSRLGIDNNSEVVVYDDAGGGIAARLWWMLRAQGVSAAVLDGGLGAWAGTLSSDQPTPTPTRFAAVEWPADMVADADEVAARSPGSTLLDARSPDRYAGRPNNIDPRFGHIPGARNAPWNANLSDQGTMAGTEALEALYALDDAADDVIIYCGSGVTACHNILALDQLGRSARLYVGSWSAWGADEARPIETSDLE